MAISANPALVDTSMHFDENEILKSVKLHGLRLKKNMRVLIEPLLRETRLKLIKTIHQFICLLIESLKIFVAPTVPYVCLVHLFTMR